MDILFLAFEGRVVYDTSVKVMVYSRHDDPTNYEIGCLDGFRIIESSPLMPPPEPPRQKVDAFIHRRGGHYGF